MTFGSGANGCLGHGNDSDVSQAKIVEKLLGFEVTQVDICLGLPAFLPHACFRRDCQKSPVFLAAIQQSALRVKVELFRHCHAFAIVL